MLTLVEAVALFTNLSQAELNNLILRLQLEEHIPMRVDLSKEHKSNMIVQFAKSNPSYQTLSGLNLVDEIVERAAELMVRSRPDSWSSNPGNAPFLHALARDGFTLTDEGVFRMTLPPLADLPQADDELHALLDEFNMGTVKGHLDQAIDNHSRGQWASANAQLRTLLEGLFDDIFRLLEPTRADEQLSSEKRRQLLATREPPFFQESLGEWGQQGKNFANGVFKRLHAEGSHPGLSDEEDCTFRLHLVLIVARHFLRRAQTHRQESGI